MSLEKVDNRGEEFEDHPLIKQAYEAADFFENGPMELIENGFWM